ncbi:MAG: transcriptional regulator GcvA [Rhodospirillaceae bacterium]|nr:transcriptional regulator GcvA [Rhodospirillaceae bacterium]
MRAFEAAARHGSFARAADELSVTQAAISQQVRELEDWLGVPLFTRPHRGVRLSQAGSRYLARLSAAFDEMSEATVALLHASAAATLTVSAEPSFAARWLLPRLPGFRAIHPEIDIDLDPSRDLVDFRSEAVDVALRYGEGDWGELVTQHLIDIVSFPVCSPALMAGAHPLRTSDDLRHHALLHDDTAEGWREWLALAGLDGVDGDRGYRFRDVNLTLEVAVAGHGVALGDNLLCAADLAAGRLVRPFAAPVAPCRAHWLVAPAAHRERPAVAAFWDWVAAEMARFCAETERAEPRGRRRPARSATAGRTRSGLTVSVRRSTP